MTWLSVKEYAQTFGVHPETVKRWIAEGKVQAVRIGDKGWWHVATPQPTTSDRAARL
jgi:excisionase family DNA binding protein